jgi:hypothetical protein
VSEVYRMNLIKVVALLFPAIANSNTRTVKTFNICSTLWKLYNTDDLRDSLCFKTAVTGVMQNTMLCI